MGGLGAAPGFDQFLGQVAAGLDQKRSRPAGRVAELDGENCGGGLQALWCRCLALIDTVVQQRVERGFDYRFGEAARGVVGAGAAAVAAGGHVDAAGVDHYWVAVAVVAQQMRIAADTRE